MNVPCFSRTQHIAGLAKYIANKESDDRKRFVERMRKHHDPAFIDAVRAAAWAEIQRREAGE